MFKPLLALASPVGPRARLSVFSFRRVHREADPLFPDELDPNGFATVCAWIRSWFRVLPLDMAVQRPRRGTRSSRAAALTFYDGPSENHGVALPVLRQFGLPCTFLVATHFLDGGRMWNDTIIESSRRILRKVLSLAGLAQGLGDTLAATLEDQRAALSEVLGRVKYLEQVVRQACVDTIGQRAETELPSDLMMTSAQVKAMRRTGTLVGAHTVSRPIVARLSAAEARQNVLGSKQRLEELLGAPVRLFAYPNRKPGDDYVQVSVAVVRDAGFDAAFSTAWGAAIAESDPMQLPRFTPWERTPFLLGLLALHSLRPRPAAAVQLQAR
jgi:peptidoglycan/xylan/chitin deacetylase (PgdA/CDA1 family)